MAIEIPDKIEIPEDYPEKIKDILRKDFLVREKENPNDPVLLAYKIAVTMHAGLKRKGKDEMDYITHPLQVYDMVKKCIGDDPVVDKDLTLAAALLHDAVEDAPKKSAEIKEVARMQAVIKIQDSFIKLVKKCNLDAAEGKMVNKGHLIDVEFPDKLVDLLTDLTNPATKMDKEEKRKYQVGKASTVPANVNLIKICDQTLNVMSNIEAQPRGWDYPELIDYTNKATAVVKSALASVDKSDKMRPVQTNGDLKKARYIKEINAAYPKAVKLAGRVYSDVSDEELRILKNMRTAGESLSDYPVLFLPMEQLVDNARRGGGKIHGFSR